MAQAQPKTEMTKLDKQVMEAMKWNEEEALADGWSSEQFFKFTEGDMLRGLFLGPGPIITMAEPDPKTGEYTEIPTWRVELTDRAGKPLGMIMRISGRYALNQFFRGLTPGNTLVGILCTGKVQMGVKQVTQFRTMAKATGGQATGKSVAELELEAEREAKAVGRAHAGAAA